MININLPDDISIEKRLRISENIIYEYNFNYAGILKSCSVVLS